MVTMDIQNISFLCHFLVVNMDLKVFLIFLAAFIHSGQCQNLEITRYYKLIIVINMQALLLNVTQHWVQTKSGMTLGIQRSVN